jgi:hypothetical protein
MDRRRASLVLLLAFVVCTAIAIVVSGGRPALQPGIAPTVVQVVGYLLAGAAAVLLTAGPTGAGRRTGAMVLAAVVLLVVLDAVAESGPNIGAGGVRLLLLIVIAVATVRVARDDAAARRVR